MNNRKRNLYILSVMVIILIAALMTACKTEDITKRAELSIPATVCTILQRL